MNLEGQTGSVSFMKMKNDEKEKNEMSWERYSSNKGRILNARDFIRVSNHLFKFSKEFLENEWGNCSHVILYINRGENKIGFEPSSIAPGALRVQMKNGIPFVYWYCFVKKYNIHLDNPIDCKIQKEGKFWVISLLNNGFKN